MEIAANTVASVTYALEVQGELIEQTDRSKPLTFLVGQGSMIPGFENQLLGKKAGDNYNITVEPSEGYGEKDPKAVVDLPKDTFVVDGQLQSDMLQEGKVIPMQDNQGNSLQGTILEVGDDTVKMDFNHMLAGKTLNFSGEIIEVRKATEDELSHGHAHGPGGHQH
jgi:FKBP-type peptidyl-prolyl cis-trans isomerase SlyD